MRFLFVSYTRTPGFCTPEEWLHRLRAYTGVLEALAIQHEVISIEQTGYRGEYEREGVQYYFAGGFGYQSRVPVALHILIKRLCPDVVLVHGTCFPGRVWQLRMMLGSKVKIIVQDHSPGPPSAPLKRWVQRFADTCIDRYFFTSAEMAGSWLAKGLISSSSKIAEVMVGSSVFHQSAKAIARKRLTLTGDPLFLWVGRLDHNKDPLTVLRAFLQYCTRHPGAVLCMVYRGGDLLEQVKALLAEHVFAANVVLRSNVAHADMQDWFSSADFFISASHSEVYGVAVVEAMSCGCIPVLSNIPSHRKMMPHSGLFFQPGDSLSLMHCLESLETLAMKSESATVIEQYQKRLSFQAIAQAISLAAAQ